MLCFRRNDCAEAASLSYTDAASVSVITVTAWQGLFDQAQPTAGQMVLAVET